MGVARGWEVISETTGRANRYIHLMEWPNFAWSAAQNRIHKLNLCHTQFSSFLVYFPIWYLFSAAIKMVFVMRIHQKIVYKCHCNDTNGFHFFFFMSLILFWLDFSSCACLPHLFRNVMKYHQNIALGKMFWFNFS